MQRATADFSRRLNEMSRAQNRRLPDEISPVVVEVERKQRWLHEKPHTERLQIGFLKSPELKEPVPPFLDIERVLGINSAP